MDTIDIDLLCGFVWIKAVNIERIFDGMNKLLQPATSCLIADDSLSILWWNNKANERPSPLGLVVIDYLFPREVGIVSFAVNAFGIGGLGGNQ